MFNTPLVSIIIPSKNEKNYIGDTLVSIKNQSYKNIEIIVVDSSNDETAKIAKRFTNKIVKKNVNITKAKNLGAKNAKGDVLVFLDADTIILDELVKNSLEFILNEGYDVVIGNVKPREKNFRALFLAKIYSGFLSLIDLSDKFIMGGYPIMMTKDFFYKIGGFNEKYAASEDIEIIKKSKIYGKVKVDKKISSIISMRRFEKNGYIRWILKWLITGIYFQIKNEPYYKDNYPIFR